MSDYYNKRWNIISGSLNDDFKKALIDTDDTLKRKDIELSYIDTRINSLIGLINTKIRKRNKINVHDYNKIYYYIREFNELLYNKKNILNEKKDSIDNVCYFIPLKL